jgi:hypothetical protein
MYKKHEESIMSQLSHLIPDKWNPDGGGIQTGLADRIG